MIRNQGKGGNGTIVVGIVIPIRVKHNENKGVNITIHVVFVDKIISMIYVPFFHKSNNEWPNFLIKWPNKNQQPYQNYSLNMESLIIMVSSHLIFPIWIPNKSWNSILTYLPHLL